MNPRIAFLTALSICPLAHAQTVEVQHGQKVLVDPQGNVIPFPASSQSTMLPTAPLVGGADSCVTPDVITGTGSFAFDTTTATTGTQGQNEPLCNVSGQIGINRDVWFTWTATFSGNAILNTCGTATFDTKLAAYSGSTCPTSAALACNDDSCNLTLQSQVVFNATAGNAYLIQIGQWGTGTPTPGTFSLNQAPPPPSNDTCAAPMSLTGAGPFAFDTTWATTGAEGQAEALCSSGATTAVAADQWFTWTATFSGTARVATCGGTTTDTKIAAYAGTTCPTNGTALSCNDDTCGTQSQIDINATQGNSYIIQIGNGPTGTPGAGTFTILNVVTPTNDDCTTPIVLPGPGTSQYDTTFATTSPQGQTTGGCGPNTFFYKDIWYTFAATASGTGTVTTCGLVTSTGTFDTKLEVFDGAGCPTGAAIICNDDGNCASQSGLTSTLSWPTVCGSTYTIQVGQYAATGDIMAGITVSESGTQCGPTGVPFCFGDGTGTACPCANNGVAGNGCASSVNANGANLSTSGVSSLANDTLALLGTGMSNSSCLYFQGTSQISVGFGDGLRCAGGTVVRLSTKTNVGGSSQYPGAGNPSISVKGAVTTPGTRTYQTWYRNAAAFCTPSTFNLTNGVLITWQ